MNEYRPFKVTLITTQEITYVVDARTSEQAEDAAEALFAEGEQPHSVESSTTIIEEVEPVEELSSDQVYSDSTGFIS